MMGSVVMCLVSAAEIKSEQGEGKGKKGCVQHTHLLSLFQFSKSTENQGLWLTVRRTDRRLYLPLSSTLRFRERMSQSGERVMLLPLLLLCILIERQKRGEEEKEKSFFSYFFLIN